MNITIPTIESLPTNIKEASLFIWKHQDALNAVSQSHNIGTIALGLRERDPKKVRLRQEALENYGVATLSECNELLDNFYWKHWSAEAKEGKRWQLINPTGETGPGTIQNVRLEIIDLLFFVTSILQTYGYPQRSWEDTWVMTYPKAIEYTGDEKQNKQISLLSLELAGKVAPFSVNTYAAAPETYLLHNLFSLFRHAGMRWELTLNLYAKKLIKNYERQLRGRKQVGDTLSEQENSEVK